MVVVEWEYIMYFNIDGEYDGNFIFYVYIFVSKCVLCIIQVDFSEVEVLFDIKVWIDEV